jgi:hypothetical protein
MFVTLRVYILCMTIAKEKREKDKKSKKKFRLTEILKGIRK